MTQARRLRFWEKAAPALRVVGAILLAAGTIHLYGDLVIFDARTFGARAALSLGDPRVAGFVAERITDEAIAQRRDLMAYRPLLVGTARTIVSSEPFRAGFRRAAQSAHAALFSQSAERLALSVPDLGVLVRSALAHDPALAARIPASLRGSVLVQPTGRGARAVIGLVKLGHRFRRNAILAIGLGVLFLLLGIALPRDRRRALLNGGAALATVALVLFFLPPLARTALTASMASAELRPVVAGVWDAFAGGLRLWALVLAGIGIVLGSAASSYASHVEIDEVGRRVWRRLREPARTWQGEILRAIVLTGLGLLAAFRPTATLQGLMVIAGALLAFEGLRELFMLVPPRLREAASHAEEALAEARKEVAHGEGLRVLVRHALVGLLAVGLIAAAIFFMRSPAALPETPAFTDACNGDRALCDRRLDEVVFPAAHNSMSAAEFDGWMFPNQELGSVSLLDHGIRALLFDVHYGTPIGGRVKTDLEAEAASAAKFDKAVGKEAVDAAMRIRDRMTGPPSGPRAAYLCHGFCELGAVPLATMLEGVRDFLVQNPGEVLVFVIEDYVTPAEIEAAFRESGLDRFVYRGRRDRALPDPARDDRLRPAPGRLRRERHEGRALVPPGLRDDPGDALHVPHAGGALVPARTAAARRRRSSRSTTGSRRRRRPRPSNAAIVNAHDFLLARAQKCQKERGKLPNILAVDFAMTGDVVGVAAEMNGLSSERTTP